MVSFGRDLSQREKRKIELLVTDNHTTNTTTAIMHHKKNHQHVSYGLQTWRICRMNLGWKLPLAFSLPLVSRGIEIRAFEQKILIQSIKPESAIKFITSSKSTLLASNYSVFKLEPLPYDGQVRSCIHNKQFELALSIAVRE